MAADASAMKKWGKSKSMMTIMGLSIRFSRKKNTKDKDCSSQVHPIIPIQLSRAWEIARPYRPCLVLNLETITEEEDDHPAKKSVCEDPTRTPLYFAKGTNSKRFRFRLRRYAKLMWRVQYAARLRRNFATVLRLFRMRRDPEVPATQALSVIQI